jgi:DNA repair exonuclease SbcCD ATPase subunit
MHIQKLTTENFMKVKFAEVNFDEEGNLIIVGGNNGQGKTSFLNSIEVLLNGAKSLPPEPLREGAESGRITAELKSEEGDPYDDLIVERTIGADRKTSLKIKSKSKKGVKYTQSMLFEIIGKLAFDPLAFKNMEVKAQVEHLKKTFDIDLSDLEKKFTESFEERTELNRDIKSLEAQFEAKEHHKDAPKEVVTVSQLSEDLEAARKHNKENQEKTDALRDLRGDLEELTEQKTQMIENVKKLKKELADFETDVKEQEKSEKTTAELITKAEKIVEKLEDEKLDVFLKKIETAEEENDKVRSNTIRNDLETDIKTKTAVADGLTEKLDGLRTEKKDRLAAVDFPVEGLGFNANGVTFKDLPFEQASGAEQLKISVSIAIAANPKLKVFLIRDGSLLDKENVKMIAKMAEDFGCQVLIEMVGEESGMTIVFEDGLIKEVAKKEKVKNEK